MLLDTYNEKKVPVGLNLYEFETLDPIKLGIFDNYNVKEQFLTLTATLAQQLLLCDEILRAGKKMGGDRNENAPAPAPMPVM